MDTPLKRWLKQYGVTAAEKKELAAAAGVSMGYLYLLVNGHRGISVEMAGRLEGAALTLRRVRTGLIEPLTRGLLVDTCNRCPYLRARQGGRKAVSA